MYSNKVGLFNKRVCFVTEELAGIGGSGGIGAAFLELAKLLSKNGATVDVLYCPITNSIAPNEEKKLIKNFLGLGIKLHFLDESIYVDPPYSYEKKSYSVAQWLAERNVSYDYIHFHDYKGLGFFPTNLKKQGLGLMNSTLVTQLHGPTRWTIETNNSFFFHEDQIKIDFMEKKSIEQADIVVSPSSYLISWLNENDFILPKDVRVIKNVCSDLGNSLTRFKRNDKKTSPISDLVFFARHEDRKGFVQFCDALDIAEKNLFENNVTVSFLGKFGHVNSQPSGIYLIDRAKKWRFPISVKSGYARKQAISYITSKENPLIVIPSPAENSPYTVLESIMLGVPIISSTEGGGPELFSNQDYDGLCAITPSSIASKIELALTKGISTPSPSESIEEIENNWLSFHEEEHSNIQIINSNPLVTFAITHYERTKKLVDAILSVAQQTYKNIEILVIDDGSKTETTLADLEKIEVLLNRLGGRLIRQENGYLGAARNCAIQNSKGEYICFLDDDDIAKPELIETLVTAAVSTSADAVNCMNIFMDEKLRGDVLARTKQCPEKVTYVPIGGPLSLTPTENCLGAATALFKKSALKDVDGYSEIKGVGHEDYELFIRLAQAGKKLIISPKALYYYEVGRPSMLSRTSMIANFRRCFNALDFTKNSQEWKDFVNLQTGKHTQIHSHNRQHWLYSQASNSNLRLNVFINDLNREDILRNLIELSSLERLPTLEIAFKEDLNPPDLSHEDDDIAVSTLVAQRNSLLITSKIDNECIQHHALDIKVDLALGRHEDAIFSITDHISKNDSISKVDVEIIEEIISFCSRKIISSEIWMKLSTEILKNNIQKHLVERISLIISKIYLLTGNKELLQAEISHLLTNYEADYLLRYPDVNESVLAGGFRSGMEHYLTFGKTEGREGFDQIKSLIDFSHEAPSMEGMMNEVLEFYFP